MAITSRTPRKPPPMDPMRKTALVAGLFYIVTFISIPTLALYSSLKTDPAWILGSGSVTGVLVGTVLELIVALAGIGTAVALYPVVKRQNEGFALGFVTSRIVEAAMIFMGVVSLLSLVNLQQDLGAVAGVADAPSLVTTGASLTAGYNWAFTVGQSLMPGFNALLLGTLLYRSGLVPRVLPALGLIGAPILLAAVATIFGVVEQYSALGGLAALPIAVWEFSLGLYLTFKGFKDAAPIMVDGRRCGGDLGWLGKRGPTAGRGRDDGRCGMTAPARGEAGRTPPRSRRSGPPGCCTAPSFGSAGDGSASRDQGRRQVRDDAPHHGRAAFRPAPGRDRRLLRGRPEPGHAGHERLGRGRARVVAEPPGAAGHGRRAQGWPTCRPRSRRGGRGA